MEPSELKKILIDKRESNSNIISQFNLLKRNTELKEILSKMFPYIDKDNTGQLLYHLRDDLLEQLCACKNPLRFIKYDKGYYKTCGDKLCIDNYRLSSIKKTTIEKYGVEHTSQLESTKQKHRETSFKNNGVYHNFSGHMRDAIYESNMEKYGAKHALQNETLLKKRNDTMLERHGTLNMINSEKTKSTNIELYGYKNAMKSSEISSKVSMSLKHRFNLEQIYKLEKWNIILEQYVSETQYYHIECKRCETKQTIAGASMNSKLRADVDPCTICNPYIKTYTSNAEDDLAIYIESLGIKVLRNVKTLVKSSELDIFLPDYNIGFEFNGVYWHSELYRNETYHKDKTSNFLKIGIKIYHVWEDDWKNKKCIIKDRILNLVSKDYIGARKCEIVNVTQVESKKFFDSTHINGNFNAKIYYGLRYNGEIISIMSFSKSRYKKTDSWELIRFASSKNVIGGASKLFNHFIKNNNPESVISFAKIDWSPDPDITVYKKIGFYLESITPPSPYWNIDGIRVHRLNFIKQKLINKGKDNTKTAIEIMHEDGYYRVYDCGNWKFRWIRPYIN